jgi:hypothetical protein
MRSDAPEPVGEYYLLHRDIALRFHRTERWVLDKIREGAFGKDVIQDSGDYLVPLSAFNAFVAARRVFDESGELKPVFARNAGELKRKLAGLRRGREQSS